MTKQYHGTDKEARQDYEWVMSHLERITGGADYLDLIPSIYCYAGSFEAIKGFMSARRGIRVYYLPKIPGNLIICLKYKMTL